MEADIRGMNPGAEVRRVSALEEIPTEIWDRVLGRTDHGTDENASDGGDPHG